jgi:hypothetical protein
LRVTPVRYPFHFSHLRLGFLPKHWCPYFSTYHTWPKGRNSIDQRPINHSFRLRRIFKAKSSRRNLSIGFKLNIVGNTFAGVLNDYVDY